MLKRFLSFLLLLCIALIWKPFGAVAAAENKATNLLSADMSSLRIGDTVLFGTYEQDGNTSNGKEAIEWIILDKDKESVILLTKFALDCIPFGDKITSPWETCSLRAWLNGDFISDSFTSAESEAILVSEVSNARDQGCRTFKSEGAADTYDKVYLLSFKELVEYYPTEESRKCLPTQYAINQGALSDTEGKYCKWWLRSPGENDKKYDNYKAMLVMANGGEASFNALHTVTCVRPVIRVGIKLLGGQEGSNRSSISNEHFKGSDEPDTDYTLPTGTSEDDESSTMPDVVMPEMMWNFSTDIGKPSDFETKYNGSDTSRATVAVFVGLMGCIEDYAEKPAKITQEHFERLTKAQVAAVHLGASTSDELGAHVFLGTDGEDYYLFLYSYGAEPEISLRSVIRYNPDAQLGTVGFTTFSRDVSDSEMRKDVERLIQKYHLVSYYEISNENYLTAMQQFLGL